MIYSSWDIVCQAEINNYGSFFALLHPPPPLKNPKNQDFEKMKTIAGDIILHISTKNHNFEKNEKNIWRCHHFTHVFTKSQHVMHVSWDMECERKFFAIFGHFLPFYPTIEPKNWNLERMRKISWEIILFHMCFINEDHIMYGFRDIRVTDSFLSFWAFFCPLTLLTTQTIKILKKWKQLPGDILPGNMPGNV